MRPQIVKIYTSVLCLMASTVMFGAQKQSANEPPPPSLQRTTGPELPIDTNLYVLFIAALALGIYVAYRKHKTNHVSQ